MYCADCVLDTDLKATEWGAAVAIWQGMSLCSQHLKRRVEQLLTDQQTAVDRTVRGQGSR